MARTAEVFVAEFTWRCPTCAKVTRHEELSRTPIRIAGPDFARSKICIEGDHWANCELTEVY